MRVSILASMLGLSLASAVAAQSGGEGPYYRLLGDDPVPRVAGIPRSLDVPPWVSGSGDSSRTPWRLDDRSAAPGPWWDHVDTDDVGEAEERKNNAIGMFLADIAGLQPGEYGEREKLLESLQLERIAALRNHIEAARSLDDDRDAAQVQDETQRAVALRSSIWPSATIPVSWDVSATVYDRYARERQWVRDAVRATWERESAVRFTGWGRNTGSNVPGIRIRIADEGPHCKGLGRNLNNKPAGMVLNFTFQNWCTPCAVNRANSIQYIAVHEFGHALGLAHEQNRPDAPSWCREERQGSDGDWRVTIYDPQSIMNYCSTKWNNDGKLTALDKRAIRVMYGNPRSSSGGSGSEGPLFPQPLQGVGSHSSDGNYQDDEYDDSGYEGEMEGIDKGLFPEDDGTFEGADAQRKGPAETVSTVAVAGECFCGAVKLAKDGPAAGSFVEKQVVK